MITTASRVRLFNRLVRDFLLQREKWLVLFMMTSGECIETNFHFTDKFPFYMNFSYLSHFWGVRHKWVDDERRLSASGRFSLSLSLSHQSSRLVRLSIPCSSVLRIFPAPFIV